MKKIVTIVLTGLMIISLAACTPKVTDNPQDTKEPDATQTDNPTETPTDKPTPEPKNAVISNWINTTDIGAAGTGSMHGGHQTRVVHTDHGTYTAYIENIDGKVLDFTINKIISDSEAKVLYRGSSPYDAAGINILVDSNGDIYVTAIPVDKTYQYEADEAEIAWLALYRVDAKTDEVTEYKSCQHFEKRQGNGYGYSMPILDVENRKIYAMYCSGGSLPGWYAWFTFDMDKKEWLDGCVTADSDVRYAYFYAFPDGNGGIYMVGERDMPVETDSKIVCGENGPQYAGYLWDKLTLFHIPDMTKPEYEQVLIHDEDYTRADEGICLNINHNQYGDVYLDKNGRLHVLYTTRLLDYTKYNGHPDGQLAMEARHAIYEGMTCIYNEPIMFEDHKAGKERLYGMRMAEDSNGSLYIIAVPLSVYKAAVEVYRATDEIGSQFELIETKKFGNKSLGTFNASCPRSNSLSDDTIDCIVDSGKYIYYFTVKFE